MARQGFIFLSASPWVVLSITTHNYRDFYLVGRGTEMSQDGKSFQKSNQSHYKDANPASGGILVGIKGSWVAPSQSLHRPQRMTTCYQWQHLCQGLSPTGAMQSRLPNTKQCTVHQQFQQQDSKQSNSSEEP